MYNPVFDLRAEVIGLVGPAVQELPQRYGRAWRVTALVIWVPTPIPDPPHPAVRVTSEPIARVVLADGQMFAMPSLVMGLSPRRVTQVAKDLAIAAVKEVTSLQ